MNTQRIKRIIYINDPIHYKNINILDINNNDVSKDCLYSWSADGVDYIDFVSKDKYNNITPNISSDFFLKILIYGNIKDILFDNLLLPQSKWKISMKGADRDLFTKSLTDSPNLFNPYNGLECALDLQSQIGDSIISIFGLPIYYIRVEPDNETLDYTFKEYSLHNVVSIKQLKLMINGGTMPSSNPSLNDFDFNWENDWETELSKSQFASAFGDTIVPKQRDMIYIPMMKRMWEVNSSYDEKNGGLMWRSTTWKVSLVKWNEKTNVEQGDFGDIIDCWIDNDNQSYENAIGKYEKDEQNKESGIEQVSAPSFKSDYASKNIHVNDAIREEWDGETNINIKKNVICHSGAIIARNSYYHLLDNDNYILPKVIYQKSYIGNGYNTLSFIIDLSSNNLSNEQIESYNEQDILHFGEVSFKLNIDENYNMRLLANKQPSNVLSPGVYIIIYKFNKSLYTTEYSVYKQYSPSNKPAYLISKEQYYFDFDNPIHKTTVPFDSNVITDSTEQCYISCHPNIGISNIKYYDRYLDKNESIKESIKYATTNKNCIINDLVRPIFGGVGYDIK